MAAPNIRGASGTINGKTVGAALGTTLTTSLLANAAASGKVLKVNSIRVSNVDGTNAADVTVDHYNGTTGYKLASAISVPAKNAYELLTKPLYLEEGQSLRGGASAAGDLEVLISYEDIS